MIHAPSIRDPSASTSSTSGREDSSGARPIRLQGHCSRNQGRTFALAGSGLLCPLRLVSRLGLTLLRSGTQSRPTLGSFARFEKAMNGPTWRLPLEVNCSSSVEAIKATSEPEFRQPLRGTLWVSGSPLPLGRDFDWASSHRPQSEMLLCAQLATGFSLMGHSWMDARHGHGRTRRRCSEDSRYAGRRNRTSSTDPARREGCTE